MLKWLWLIPALSRSPGYVVLALAGAPSVSQYHRERRRRLCRSIDRYRARCGL